jgi:hypothetical protein
MMMDITAELKRDNPMCRDIEIEAYANALKAYVEASENIEKKWRDLPTSKDRHTV